jgi:hypothetical protein
MYTNDPHMPEALKDEITYVTASVSEGELQEVCCMQA